MGDTNGRGAPSGLRGWRARRLLKRPVSIWAVEEHQGSGSEQLGFTGYSPARHRAPEPVQAKLGHPVAS
jgi:hypothetical protein